MSNKGEHRDSPLQSCCMKMYYFLTMLSGKKYCVVEFLDCLYLMGYEAHLLCASGKIPEAIVDTSYKWRKENYVKETSISVSLYIMDSTRIFYDIKIFTLKKRLQFCQFVLILLDFYYCVSDIVHIFFSA